MDVSISVLVNKILSNDLLKSLFICVLIVVLHISFLLGIFYGIIIFGSYVLGFYAFSILLRRINNAGDVLPIIVDAVFLKTTKRGKSSAEGSSQPRRFNYPRILVPSDIDAALEHLLNRVLDQYVSNWYSNISSDPSFQYEIRLVIQNIISICYKRILRIQAEEFLLKGLLPIYLNHISSYDDIKFNNEVSRLHIAVHSRTAEVLYVQNVSRCLLKHFLPKSGIRCKSYYLLLREILSRSLLLSISDLACNPAVLNSLLLYYLKGNFQFLSSERVNNVEKIELLEKFTSRFRSKVPYSPIRPDVLSIMKDNDLLNAFMHYLKDNDADIVLQFCIDIGNFIERISKVEIEAEELDSLYRDAWDLYSVYFSSHSPSCIKFKKDFALSMRKALSKDVLKLKNAATLFEAQEQAYTVLDKFCYGFHCSGYFYSWLYGPHDASEATNSDNSQSLSQSPPENNKKPAFELSSKLNKIKDVLKPNAVQEGQALVTLDKQVEFESTMTEMGEEMQTTGANERNLNTWKVNIPTVGSRLDPITNKAYTVFVIQIQTDDNREWLVERRPVDFYSLDFKLTEFHGPSVDAQLPPKRLFTRLESIQLYEEYLNRLIRNPVLKNSELLHTFLTSTEEFVGEDTSFGKLFRKSVVPTLRKERGQNLEGFLNTFVTSCRTTKYEWKDLTEKQGKGRSTRSMSGADLYENHFDISADISQQIFCAKSSPPANDPIFTKISSSILYIGVKAYGIRKSTIKFLLSLQPVFGGLVDQLLIYFTKRCLCNVLTSCNIVYFINLIERNLFDNRSKLDIETQNRLLTESLNDSKNSRLHSLHVLIHETLQDPKMNKQLFYKLMDAVLVELFPELDINS